VRDPLVGQDRHVRGETITTPPGNDGASCKPSASISYSISWQHARGQPHSLGARQLCFARLEGLPTPLALMGARQSRRRAAAVADQRACPLLNHRLRRLRRARACVCAYMCVRVCVHMCARARVRMSAAHVSAAGHINKTISQRALMT